MASTNLQGKTARLTGAHCAGRAALSAALEEQGAEVLNGDQAYARRIEYLVHCAGPDAEAAGAALEVQMNGLRQLADAAEAGAADTALEAIVLLGIAGAERGGAASAREALVQGALPGFTRYLAQRLAPKVRVNACLAAADAAPEQIAETLTFLLSDTTFITGTVLTLDGGRGL